MKSVLFLLFVALFVVLFLRHVMACSTERRVACSAQCGVGEKPKSSIVCLRPTDCEERCYCERACPSK